MAKRSVLRPDSPESKSDASASGPGVAPPDAPRLPDEAEQATEGKPRNTPPDNPFDDVRTSSNE
ncbi:MAG TPA: hypothetical protein VFO35_10305 [Steroidobacteraceae bacterium]|nr:hypothetical protein [Steroidobacteraceae bacterium]